MSEISLKRKLDDLRVVDLRSELEKRGLDKNGVKATLMERLKQAIENEGGDIKTYEFILSTSTTDSPHKRPKRRQGSLKGGDVDGEEDEEDHTFESLADLVQENGDPGEVRLESGDAQSEKLNHRHHQGSEPPNDDDQAESLTIDDSDDQERGVGGSDNKESGAAAALAVKIDQSSLPASNYSSENDAPPMEVDRADLGGGHSDNDDDDDEQDIPNPEQVEPPCMFTTEDTIRLHEAALEDKARRLMLATDKSSVGGGSVGEPLTDEASSMYVNADESMSEMNSVTTVQSGGNNNVPSNKLKEDDSVDSTTVNQIQEDEPNNVVPNAQGSAEATKVEGVTIVPGDDNKEQTDESTVLKSDVVENKKELTSESQPEQQETADAKVTKEEPKKAEQKNPECCLWVSGIPSTIKAADLKSLFSKHGRVISAKVVKIKFKGGVQWYGNLIMNSAEEASKCITNLHRTEVHGKSISIERGDGSYPPKRLTAANAVNASKTPAPVAAPGTAEQQKPAAEALAASKPEAGTNNSATKQGPSSVKGKKSPSGDDKKKPESVKGDKTKLDKDKREPSKSKSDRATRRSSKERRPYRESFHSNRAARAVINVARRRIITGRGPPPPPYRGMRGGPPHRGGPYPRRSGPPPPRSSYRGSSRGGPPYRPPPPPLMQPTDYRRQRESEMMERMKYREMEHRQREEKLLIQREKERIRFERERLEREKLELQQVRMQAAYERSAALASTQQMMAAGVKRAYEGLDPYGSQEPDMKRANYGTPSGMAPPGSGGSRSSSRRSPPRSYRGRPSGGGGDSYRSGGGGRTSDVVGSGSRYDSSRSSRDGRPSNGASSSSGGGGGAYRSSRRSDVPSSNVGRSSRGSRYSSPPAQSSRRSGPPPPPLMSSSSSSHSTPRSSWGGGGAGRQDDSMTYRGSGSSMGMATSGSSGVGQMRNWQSGNSSTTPTSQWRSMASSQMHAQPSSGMGNMMYGMTSQSSSYTPSSEGRFNAYDYTASSARRY